MKVRLHRTVIVVAACILLVGCGSSDRVETVAVRGKVTFQGGECPAAGHVRFLPIESAEGFPRRPGFAKFERDGRFVATSYESGDGLVPGTYRVQIECWKTPPAMGKPGVSHMPDKFVSRELKVEADASSPVELEYDVVGK